MGTIRVPFGHLLDAGCDDDLGKHTLKALRERRKRLEEAEAAISFTRRLLHGRIDIVESELQRRRSGQSGRDLAELVHDLPKILAGTPGSASNTNATARAGRLVEVVPAACVQQELMDLADGIVSPLAMTTLDCQPVATAERIVEELRSLEQELSSLRREAHERIAQVQTEVALRYAVSGSSDVDTYASLEGQRN